MFSEKYFLISDYQSMELLGVKGLFTTLRVDQKSLPEGFYKYSLREGEDDFLSSVNKNVWHNHMGDFICKKELDMNGQDECDIFGDYSFTEEKVDLNAFFGEDINLKIAQAIDAFYYDFDTHEYTDSIPAGCTREDVLNSIYDGLSDKKYVSGMIDYFKKVHTDNREEHFLSDRDEQTVVSFVQVLTRLNTKNRDRLDTLVDMANDIKGKQENREQTHTPEIQ